MAKVLQPDRVRAGSRTGRWGLRVGLVLLGIAVALGIGEIGLRALGWTGLDEGREAYQFDPELGWTLRPQISVRRASAEYQHQVATGPHGFRGDPPRGAARTVVVLGDSFVEAFQVPRAHTFVARLDEALGPDTQVLNYGVSGYAPDQEALLWQRLAPTVPAQDVVLLVYGANDVLGVLRDRGHGMAKPVVTEVPRDDGPLVASGPALVPPAQGRRSGLRRLALYAVALRAVTSSPVSGLLGGLGVDLQDRDRPTDLLGVPASAEVLRGFERLGHLLAWLDRKVAADGARLWVVYAPSRLEVDAERFEAWAKDGALDRLQGERLLLDLCSARGLRCLSLREPLETALADGVRAYYPRDSHWDASGHETVARVLAEALR